MYDIIKPSYKDKKRITLNIFKKKVKSRIFNQYNNKSINKIYLHYKYVLTKLTLLTFCFKSQH